MRSICIATVAIGLFGPPSGHAQSASSRETSPSDASRGSGTPQAGEDTRREHAIYRFEGGAITVGDVEDALAQEPLFVRRAYRDREKLRQYAQRMLRTRLLAREARRRGLDEHPNVRRIVKKHAIQKLIKETIDDEITPESISAKEIQAYFEAHRERFNRPTTRRASHILAKDAKTAAELTKKAKKADLREFRRLAREHSRDEATKLRGGDLGYFDAQGEAPHQDPDDPRVAEPIVEAAFSLEESGDVVSSPVEVEGGYSIVMLTGSRPAVTRTWKDVEDTIRSRLWRKRRQEAVEQLVAELKKKHPPEVQPQPLADIDIEQAPPGSEIKPGFPRQHESTSAAASR